MPLIAGARIGAYEIVAPLGAGGMGEVYRARDSKLGREVAIKVMPAALAADPEYLGRFQREAQVLASLNHPNIAAIYGIEDGAIVMELIEGANPKGPMPLDDAVGIARQVAEALEAAHEKGIIHRDLKPGNLKVTPEGLVKVLDFGLAKAAETHVAPADSQTMTMRDTRAGVVMGTPGYMSPEQAMGRPVDKRADIWSFGIVLLELLAGHTDDEPDLDRLPAATPPAIRELLRRCLDRSVKTRLRDIGEARVVLSTTSLLAPPAPRRRAMPAWPWAAAFFVTLLGANGAWFLATRPHGPHSPIRFNVEISRDLAISRSTAVAISPDGTRLVVRLHDTNGASHLYTRLLAEDQLTALPGTEGAMAPFFSPNGQWVGFVGGGGLQKVSVTGGAPIRLCDASAGAVLGASWGDDDNIVFIGPSRNVMRVPSAGGTPSELTRPQDPQTSPKWPEVLPRSKVVIYTADRGNTLHDDATIEAFSMEHNRTKTVHKGGFSGRFLPTPDGGRLLYLHRDTLFAAPFDWERLSLAGNPAPVLEGVSASLDGGGEYAVSKTGTLVFLPGTSRMGMRTLFSIDRAGKTDPLLATPGTYFSPRFSPDGKRLAMSADQNNQTAIWIKDLDRDAPTRITFLDGVNDYPVWTPDGHSIVFYSNRSDRPGIYQVRADGGGEPKRMSDGSHIEHPYSFSPDGKHLAVTVTGAGGSQDIAVASVDGDRLGNFETFLATPFTEGFPTFSPDGRWIAYVSNETGTLEVYVRPYPGPGGRWQISNGEGRNPVWSRAAKELLYRAKDGQVMSVSYTATGDTFQPGKTQAWPEAKVPAFATVWGWDLSPDGKRMVALQATEGGKPETHLTFVLNFAP
jgi:Tol biopolymer transport system component